MTRKARAILIGASRTANASPVPKAETVVHRISALLDKQFGSNATITELVGNDATHEKVMDALATARAAASDGELFVLLFAGHGAAATAEQPFQAWALADNDRFTDLELAQELLAFDARVDTVVVSACCYGAGVFKPGPFSKLVDQLGAGLPKPQDLSLQIRLRMLNQERVAFLKSAFAAKEAPMVCISAAERDGMVIASVLEDLANEIERSTLELETYQQLDDRLAKHKFVGHVFEVDARPSPRMNDTVLATT